MFNHHILGGALHLHDFGDSQYDGTFRVWDLKTLWDLKISQRNMFLCLKSFCAWKMGDHY